MMNHTIFVTFEETGNGNGNFAVYDMRTGEKKIIKASSLQNNLFKMPSDFKNAFKNAFPGKLKVVYSEPAFEEVNILMEFNRVDS
ncbi:MAG: hypothetical protein BHV99_05640 [Clostridium sp. 26_21]|nr:MAG: hypothetical protein BHV99_05640 [Clostridium sp. 26_21]